MSRKVLIRRITLGVFAFASCNLVWQFFSLYLESIERERIYLETGWFVCYFGPPRELLARFHIELFLLLALIGNRLKGLPNTLLNVVGLTGAVISYILWWQYIFRIVRNAETNVDGIPNFAYLVGGNVLDLGIAASIVLLVLLNVRDAGISSFRVSLDD